jgi:hypothetical protein
MIMLSMACSGARCATGSYEDVACKVMRVVGRSNVAPVRLSRASRLRVNVSRAFESRSDRLAFHKHLASGASSRTLRPMPFGVGVSLLVVDPAGAIRQVERRLSLCRRDRRVRVSRS